MPIARSVIGRNNYRAPPAVGLQSLLFPANSSGTDNSSPIVAIRFANPHSNGLPLWGPSNAGITIFRRYKPMTAVAGVTHIGYSSAFWYTDNDSFESGFGSNRGYWGFHGYPQSGGTAGTSSYWEIAADQGDAVNNGSGSPIAVVDGQWFLQALRIVRNSANSKTFTFYTNLPSVAAADVITFTVTTTNYGEASPPQDQPQITIGDSPWYATYQHERAHGYLGEHLIYGVAATQTEIVDQAALIAGSSTTLLPAIASAIWWGKKGFASVDDLTCDFATGRSFSWIDSGNKATLGSLT